jgi:hypothetical protein
MKHRSRDRPRRADGDSPLADRTLTPRGPERGNREGQSDVASLSQACLAMTRRAGFRAGVAPSGDGDRSNPHRGTISIRPFIRGSRWTIPVGTCAIVGMIP